jgi:hypothetical protein
MVQPFPGDSILPRTVIFPVDEACERNFPEDLDPFDLQHLSRRTLIMLSRCPQIAREELYLSCRQGGNRSMNAVAQ